MFNDQVEFNKNCLFLIGYVNIRDNLSDNLKSLEKKVGQNTSGHTKDQQNFLWHMNPYNSYKPSTYKAELIYLPGFWIFLNVFIFSCKHTRQA